MATVLSTHFREVLKDSKLFLKAYILGALMVNICLVYDQSYRMTSFFEKPILVGALMVNICLGYDRCLHRKVIE